MNLRQWIRGEYRTSGLANPSLSTLDSFGLQASYSGERVTIQDAMTLAAVRAAVAMISQAIGGLPLKVYRIVDNDERIEARTHRTWRMLHDKPNDHCIAKTFWTATAAQLLIYENAFIYKERDPDGIVSALYHLDPNQVRVETDGTTKRYVIEGPPRKVYTDDDVVHIVGFSMDGYYGTSRINQARQTLGTALARAKFEGGFYKRGAKTSGVIEHPGRLGEQGIKNLASGFAKIHSSADQMHKVPILEEGATFKTVQMSLLDMQFAELAEQTRTEIAVLFNVPAAYLGASTGDSLTYATTESNQIQFATMAVLPIADSIAKSLSSDPAILPWDVMFCEFTLEGLLRADMKTRAEYWKTLKDMGVVDEAYIASRENLPAPPPKPKPVAPPVAPFGTNGGSGTLNVGIPPVASVQSG